MHPRRRRREREADERERENQPARSWGHNRPEDVLPQNETGVRTPFGVPNPGVVSDSNYWIGVAGAPKGSVGAVPPATCQIVLPALTANERVPVVPFVIGRPVA